MYRELPDCKRCQLSKNCVPVVPWSSSIAKIMIIGEKPNSEDDLYGRPFSGREGANLLSVMTFAGLNRLNTHMTYAIKSYSKEKPKKESVTACSYWLNKERQLVEPKIKIVLGKEAAKMVMKLLKDKSFDELVGKETEGFFPWYSASKMLNAGIKLHERSILFFKEMKDKAYGSC